ncbi:MAG: cadherin-like beta sandwich domain-containing protein [Proteobacteria bacterium]|nr:cadherin-like beta sandwich domain-containing protein [Pseudomonadota bacterium]
MYKSHWSLTLHKTTYFYVTLIVLQASLLTAACTKAKKADSSAVAVSTDTAESTSATELGLSRLETSLGDLLPAFDPAVLNYKLSQGVTANLRYNIHAVPARLAHTVKVNDKLLSSDYTTDVLRLEAGENLNTITVHSSEGLLLKTYTITIERAAELADADLLGLDVSMGAIVPEFSTQIFEYTLTVPVGYSVLTISPQIAYPELASLEFNDKSYDPNEGSYDFSLVPGLNNFRIRITGKSGKVKTYVLKVTQPSL